MTNAWTEDEINLLTMEYEDGNIDDIIVLLPDRTEAAIKAKARNLGLVSNKISTRPNKWLKLSNDDKKIVDQNITKSARWIQRNKLPNVSYMEILTYIKESTGDTATWSGEEIQILRNNYSSSSMDELRKLLPRRTSQSITAQAYRMGYKKKGRSKPRIFNKWTADEDKILETYYIHKTVYELFDMLDHRHTFGAIVQRASVLGISKK